MRADQREWIAPAVLRWGFVCTIALAVTAAAVSVVDVQETRRQVDALARTADRSSFLVGEIGRHVSRLRAAALEQGLAPGDESVLFDEHVPATNEALDAAIGELEALLQIDERPRWERFLSSLGGFRARLAEAESAARRGEDRQAERLLVGEASALAAALQAELDVLGRLNQEESQRLLEEADGRLARLWRIQVLVDAGLVLGLGAIWWVLIRTLGRQRREMAAHMARIEASNRDLDAFAGRIAHDLRNALAPLTFIAARLRREGGAPEASGTVAMLPAQLERTVQQSRALIDGLLAFSRATHAADREARAPLARTVEEAVGELAAAAERLGVRVDVEVTDAAVACAPGLLHIVVLNLASNAVKFLEGCSPRVLRVTAGPRDGWGEVVVADTGPGIPADAVPRIWEPFYRVPGVAAPGTGIGLATVRRIVDAHGGDIAIDSTPGRGSTFRVRLPLHPEARRPESPPHRTPEASRQPGPA